jgi:putative transcriptional regulator
MAKIPIQAARIAKGYTQESLAEKLGVSRETIVAWEKDPMKMKPYYLYAFLYITGFCLRIIKIYRALKQSHGSNHSG